MKVYTNSALKTFRLCPRKFYYDYECLIGMRDAGIGSAMDKGIEIHKAIQGKLAGFSLEELDINLVTYPEIAVLYGYYETEGTSIAKYLEGEKQLHMVIPKQGIILAGKLDGIIRNSNDEINVLEIKSSRFKLGDDEDVLTKWEVDRQLSMYSILARHNGINHNGLIVDYLRTPSLRQNKDENDNAFLDRINKDVANNLDTYYGKIAVGRTVEHDNECLKETLQEIAFIKSCRAKDIWPRDSESCNEYHKKCHYAKLCSGETNVSQYTKRTHQHTELDETLFPKIAPIF